MKLDERLEKISSMVNGARCVADVGTDHAYLAVNLVQSNRSIRAIATDVNEGPLKAAEKTVSEAGLKDKIELRLGNGLGVLKPNEADVICIAGMGGMLMINILEKSMNVLETADYMVLQPMNAAPLLRRFIYGIGWEIVSEELVADDDKMYEIIKAANSHGDKADNSEDNFIDDILYWVGPCLWKEKNPLLHSHLKRLLNREMRSALGMEKSLNAVSSEKYKKSLERIEKIKEMMTR